MKRTRMSKPLIFVLALTFLILGALESHAAMSCQDLFDETVSVEMVIPYFNVPVTNGTRVRAAKSTLLIRGLIHQIETRAQKPKAMSEIVEQTMFRVIHNGAVELDGVTALLEAVRPQAVFAVPADQRGPYSALLIQIGLLARAGDWQMRRVINNGLHRHAIVSPASPGDQLATPENRAKFVYLNNATDGLFGADQFSWTF